MRHRPVDDLRRQRSAALEIKRARARLLDRAGDPEIVALGLEQGFPAMRAVEQHAKARAALRDLRGGIDREGLERADPLPRHAEIVGELLQLHPVVDRERHHRVLRAFGRDAVARGRPMHVGEAGILAHRARGGAMPYEMLHFPECRIFHRAQQARHGEGAAGIGIGAAGFDGFIAKISAQKAGHEGVAGAQHVEHFHRKAGAANPFVERRRNRAGIDRAAHRAALEHQQRLRHRAHAAQRAQRVVGPARDHHLLFRADDEVAMGQDGLQMRGDTGGFEIALLARAMAREAPEIGAVVDVEADFPAMLPGERHCLPLRLGGIDAGKMRAGDDDRGGRGDMGLVDVALVQSRIGAIVAVEDQRKRLVVAHAEQHQRGEAFRVGLDALHVDALAHKLLADETAHVLVADPRHKTALETEARRADGDVGGAAADGFGKARHVFETSADLLAVEVHGGPPDGDDVKDRLHGLLALGRWARRKLSRHMKQ